MKSPCASLSGGLSPIVVALALAAFVTGCQQNRPAPSGSDRQVSPYAGGEGPFGEDPSQPGTYPLDR